MVTIVLVLLGEDQGVGDLSLFPSLGPVFWEKLAVESGWSPSCWCSLEKTEVLVT